MRGSLPLWPGKRAAGQTWPSSVTFGDSFPDGEACTKKPCPEQGTAKIR